MVRKLMDLLEVSKITNRIFRRAGSHRNAGTSSGIHDH